MSAANPYADIVGGYSTGPTSYAVSGGNMSYKKPTSMNTAVLGANTGPSSNQTQQNNGKSIDQQWRDAGNTGDRPVGWNGNQGGSGGGEQDLSGQISDAYAPALQALESWLGSANQGATEDTANLENRVKTQSASLVARRGESEGARKTEQDRFNFDLKSGLEDAYRAFNALSQQGSARFGRGNSAGQAVGELAQQEFLRNQGGIQKEQSEGDLQFEGERTKIKMFYDEQDNELLNYKNEAVSAIQKGLRDTLNEIANRRGEIEANKTNARLAALQNAKDTAQRVSEGYTQYKRDLVSTALTNMQTAAGKAFTPQEFAANLSFLEQTVMGSSSVQNPAAASIRSQGNSSDWVDQTKIG